MAHQPPGKDELLVAELEATPPEGVMEIAPALVSVLLRFDPLIGASFDVLTAGSQNWLCDFLAWRREGGDMWLVPARASGPYFCLTKSGLDACEGAPYANASERYAGIIRAIKNPAFEGRF